MNLIRRAPKRSTAVLAMVLAAVIIPAVVFAWGPSRETFTIEKPAGYVTFNSITNNPAHRDERNFVQVKEATANNSTYAENVSVKPGKEYTVFVYYHNNAATNLNASGKGIATGAYVKAELPAVIAKGSTGTKANGYVGAANATPQQVWDDISFSNSTAGDIALRYVPGSAKIFNKGASNGSAVADSIVTTGAPIGYNALDGKVPGCNEFSGYVTFNVTADQPNFELSKQVRLEGTTEWKETVEAKPGATVEYQLKYSNTGTTRQNNVVLRDTLPTGVTYVPGSTYLKNMNNVNPVKVNDNLTTPTGINIGDYLPGSVAYVKFSAKVNSDKEAFCKPTTLKNVARVDTNNGSKTDDADVTVKPQDCKPPVVKYVCNSLEVKKLTTNSARFTTSYLIVNATFKNITYVIRNESGTVVDRKVSTDRTLDYTQNTPGKYSVEALLTVTVNGQDKTAPGINCKGNFEIPKKVVPKYTCNALDVKSISRTEFRFSTAYTVENATFKGITYTIRDASGKVVDTINATTNSSTYTRTQAGAYTVQATVSFTVNGETKTATNDKCKDEFKVKDLPKEITVCVLATKEYPVTIKESEFDASKHSKNPEDCKEAPKTIEVCEISTKDTITINEKDFDASKHTTDFSKCEDTPVTPPELPTTGAGENIVAIVGLGAMIASIAYYAASRRALNQ